MAFYSQKYKYGNLVVEVRRVADIRNGGRFKCVVRGFGHNSPAPRGEYIVEAETNAKASRNALQMYKDEHKDDGEKGTEEKS